MGVIFWFLGRFLHIMKPFAKIALIESLMEVLMGYLDESEETTAEEPETTEPA